MKKTLTYEFYNPNTDDETIAYLTTLLAKSIVHKVESDNQLYITNQKDNNQSA